MKFSLMKKLGLAFGILMISGISVQAANWHSFSATMPAYMGTVSSNSYNKESTDLYMSFKGTSIPVSVNMVLMNSNNQTRSDRLTYNSGRTAPLWANEINGATQGYSYHLRLNTSTSETSTHNVSGYWSPDYIKN